MLVLKEGLIKLFECLTEHGDDNDITKYYTQKRINMYMHCLVTYLRFSRLFEINGCLINALL